MKTKQDVHSENMQKKEVNRTGTEQRLSGHTHDDESGTDTKLCL